MTLLRHAAVLTTIIVHHLTGCKRANAGGPDQLGCYVMISGLQFQKSSIYCRGSSVESPPIHLERAPRLERSKANALAPLNLLEARATAGSGRPDRAAETVCDLR